jgi:hypothetical protein
VGKYEQAFADVGSAAFCRTKDACRNAVTHCLKVCAHILQPERHVPWYVLKEKQSWAYFVDDARDVRPDVAGVVLPKPFARDGKRLARVAATDEIHNATPRAAVEGFNVSPDRCRIQPPFLHARNKDCGGIGFDLDMTHGSCRHDGSNSEAESPNPGT